MEEQREIINKLPCQDNELLIFLREKQNATKEGKLQQAGRASAPAFVCLGKDKQNYSET